MVIIGHHSPFYNLDIKMRPTKSGFIVCKYQYFGVARGSESQLIYTGSDVFNPCAK